ncbi:MAG TPA: uracil-DNA glycosylase [Phycisphaerales bacterium]|nr:uracil-DNA glycosylase [Phycisphaerales bacterium]
MATVRKPADPAALVRQNALGVALMGIEAVPAFTRSAAPEVAAAAARKLPPVEGCPDAVDYPPSPQSKALEAVRQRYLADAPHNAFGYSFTNLVFGEGDPCAKLMFIGEAPGADEDRTGRPFVGRAGALLNNMIKAMGLRRQDVYIANVLKVRPPNNATPTHEERAASAPYLFDQIAAIRPQVIVTLGLPATQVVLGSDQSMGRLRSIWGEFRHPDTKRHPDVIVPVMPTYHPAYLLRAYTAENRNMVWADLKKAMDKLGLKGAATPAQ